jgi:hypothetical protein
VATRPTYSDFVSFLGFIPGTGDVGAFTDVFNTALEQVETRCTIPTDAAAYPAGVRLGVLMQANRLQKRRTSPEGVAGFGELGVVRISSFDADVESLLLPYLKLDGFA